MDFDYEYNLTTISEVKPWDIKSQQECDIYHNATYIPTGMYH